MNTIILRENTEAQYLGEGITIDLLPPIVDIKTIENAILIATSKNVVGVDLLNMRNWELPTLDFITILSFDIFEPQNLCFIGEKNKKITLITNYNKRDAILSSPVVPEYITVLNQSSLLICGKRKIVHYNYIEQCSMKELSLKANIEKVACNAENNIIVSQKNGDLRVFAINLDLIAEQKNTSCRFFQISQDKNLLIGFEVNKKETIVEWRESCTLNLVEKIAFPISIKTMNAVIPYKFGFMIHSENVLFVVSPQQEYFLAQYILPSSMQYMRFVSDNLLLSQNGNGEVFRYILPLEQLNSSKCTDGFTENISHSEAETLKINSKSTLKDAWIKNNHHGNKVTTVATFFKERTQALNLEKPWNNLKTEWTRLKTQRNRKKERLQNRTQLEKDRRIIQQEIAKVTHSRHTFLDKITELTLLIQKIEQDAFSEISQENSIVSQLKKDILPQFIKESERCDNHLEILSLAQWHNQLKILISDINEFNINLHKQSNVTEEVYKEIIKTGYENFLRYLDKLQRQGIKLLDKWERSSFIITSDGKASKEGLHEAIGTCQKVRQKIYEKQLALILRTIIVGEDNFKLQEVLEKTFYELDFFNEFSDIDEIMAGSEEFETEFFRLQGEIDVLTNR